MGTPAAHGAQRKSGKSHELQDQAVLIMSDPPEEIFEGDPERLQAVSHASFEIDAGRPRGNYRTGTGISPIRNPFAMI